MHHWKITLDTTIHTGHFLISYDDSEKVDGDIGDLYDDLNDGDNDVGMGHGLMGIVVILRYTLTWLATLALPLAWTWKPL